MPGISLDLFKSFSTQDLADLGDATAEDPSLLTPPSLTRGDRLKRQLNDVTRYFGMVFHNPEAIKVAQFREEEFAKEEQGQMLGRLLPALGAARSQRAEVERQDKIEKQREVMAMRRERLAEQATKSLVYVDPVTGKTRGLRPDEVEEMVNHQIQTLDNPEAAGPPFIPDNIRRLSPEEEEAGKTRVRKEEDLAADMDPRRIKLDADKASRNAFAAAAAGVSARTSDKAIAGMKKMAQARSDIIEERQIRQLTRKAEAGDPAAKELADYVKRGTQSTGLGPVRPSIDNQIKHLSAEARKYASQPGGLEKNKARLEAIAELIEELQGAGKAQLAPVSFGGGDE